MRLPTMMTASVLAALASSPVAAQSRAGPEIPLSDYLGILHTVEATVEGQTGTFLFDTGGGVSVVTVEFAERIGCTPWGNLSGFRLSGERLDLKRCDDIVFDLGNGVSLTSPAAGVFDLKTLLPPEGPVDGILSLDAFADQPFTLDLAARRIVLETPDSLAARIDGAVEVPVHFARQAGGYSLTVLALAETDAGDLWLQLDSGGVPPLLLAPHAAAAMGVPEAAGPAEPFRLALGAGERRAMVDVAPTVRPNMIIDGNIGEPTMARMLLTFDLANERLWVRPVTEVSRPAAP
ncbi:MAG: retropepsin-like domain-containing protein [Brevundimonas sp.]|nr:retropepsin-like domain-containing protein [Brevundimonas sp.]